MKNAWIRFGCFITGYDFNILNQCSEVAKKTVKRYTAALIIMCILWGLIGFAFANRYLHSTVTNSIVAMLVFIIIIVQIERQIIMQTHKNSYLQFFRGVIAVMMALIGSLIIDQIIFKDDIDLEKEQFINVKTSQIYPDRAAERKKLIHELDSVLAVKEIERKTLQDDVFKNPTRKSTTIEVSQVPIQKITSDSIGNTTTNTILVSKPKVTTQDVENPNNKLLPALDSQIAKLQTIKIAREDSLANLRTSIENSLKAKTGFLDELNIMWSLLSKSTPAALVYIVWFLLLLGLELFILMNKRHERPTDYDAVINHQMQIHLRKLEILSTHGNGSTVNSLKHTV